MSERDDLLAEMCCSVEAQKTLVEGELFGSAEQRRFDLHSAIIENNAKLIQLLDAGYGV